MAHFSWNGPISQSELTLVSHVRGNRGVETFEEVFDSFGRGGETVFHSFLCEVFGQFIKDFGYSWGAA